MSNSRLDLWRKTIFLFKNQHAQSGPFAKCGYTQFEIEHYIKDGKIDIVVWNPNGADLDKPYYALELTVNPDANKNNQLEAYSKLDSSEFYSIGIQSNQSPIAILITNNYLENHASYCQLELKDSLTAYNLNHLDDSNLESELSKDVDLLHVPQTSFTIIPEMNNTELRIGLIDSIMSVFSPKYDNFTAETVMNLALDFISEKIDIKTKKELKNRINRMLYSLSQRELKEYVSFKDGIYTLTEYGHKSVLHPSSRESLQRKLQSWAKNKNTTLDNWIN